MLSSRDNPPTDFLPSESVPIVRLNPQTHERELVRLRWGLVPFPASNPFVGRPLIHARSESVATRPAFRDAFRQRRCLVVVDGFDIGKGRGGNRSHVIQMKDHCPFGVGAIWDRWEMGDGEPLESCALITTSANEVVRPINNRMSVIIANEDYNRWLDPTLFDAEELQQTMQPYSAEEVVVAPAG
jgi:putative SOS response-associated peptidase YedK